MKGKIVLFLLATTLLLGCSSVSVEKPKPEPQPTSQVNHPVLVELWQITLKPKVEEQNHPGFETYNIEFIYQGNDKITNAKISVGNGSVELHDISHGEGGMLGSTFPVGTKKVDFQMSSTGSNGETMIQSIELITGE